MVDKITTVPKSKVGSHIGRLDDEDIVRLNQAALVFLGLVVVLTLRLLRNLGFFAVGETPGNSAGEKGQ